MEMLVQLIMIAPQVHAYLVNVNSVVQLQHLIVILIHVVKIVTVSQVLVLTTTAYLVTIIMDLIVMEQVVLVIHSALIVIVLMENAHSVITRDHQVNIYSVMEIVVQQIMIAHQVHV